MIYKEYYTLFTSYFIEIGLAREMYLPSNSKDLYPLHHLCSNECDEKTAVKKLKMVPLDVMSEALTLKDCRGNTMIHIVRKSNTRMCDRYA